MRRLLLVIMAFLAATTLILSSGCKKKNIREDPESGNPSPGSEKPPIPR